MTTTTKLTYNRFPEIIKALPELAQEAMRESAEAIESAAKQAAPVDDGTLRENIKAKRDNRTLWTVGSRPPAWHGHLVEYGTTGGYAVGGIYAPATHPGTPAQPWLTPAAEAERGEFQRRVRELLAQL